MGPWPLDLEELELVVEVLIAEVLRLMDGARVEDFERCREVAALAMRLCVYLPPEAQQRLRKNSNPRVPYLGILP